MISQRPAMMPVLKGKESNMINKLLGAAAMAAILYGTAPASAATRVLASCSGDSFAKTESTIDDMADVPAKFVAQREIAQAQAAMLDGKMGACAMHLSRAMHAGTMAQAPYQAPYGGTMGQAPAAPTQYHAPSWTP